MKHEQYHKFHPSDLHTNKGSVVTMSCTGIRLYLLYLLIGRPPYFEDRFRYGHSTAIIKIWLTFEDQRWFRAGLFLSNAV